MIGISILFVFLFGISIGSFLNVVIDRTPAGKTLRGYSYCPFCRTTLKWYDLIPILSFLILRGKCRYCKKPISIQYPLVELATGILFVLSIKYQVLSINFQNLLVACFLLLVACFLIVIFVIDLKHFIIPDKIIYPAIGIAFIYQLFGIFYLGFFSDFGFRISDFKALINPLSAAFLAGAFFFLLVLVSHEKWMGGGDVKLVFFMGLILGWPKILVALFLAFIFGAIIGIGLIAVSKKKLSSEIPFGPFLCGATFIALFWGKEIIGWYLKLM